MEIVDIRIKEVIIPWKVIKKDSKEDMTDFLHTLNKLSSIKSR